MPIGILPPLPYAPDALKPVLEPQTVHVHHGVLQARYVAAVQDLVAHQDRARASSGVPEDLRRRLRLAVAQSLAFNEAGAVLHRLYWDNLCTPGHGERPSQALHTQICQDFQEAPRFSEEMSDIAIAIPGDGWAVLVWLPDLERLAVLAIQSHMNGWIPNAVPLLVFDVWEHAYFLQYQGDRSAYIRGLWRLINWTVVNVRYANARNNT